MKTVTEKLTEIVIVSRSTPAAERAAGRLHVAADMEARGIVAAIVWRRPRGQKHTMSHLYADGRTVDIASV